ACPPAAVIPPATARPPSSTASATTTAAPSSAKSRAAIAPMPLPAPVMTATFPSNLPTAPPRPAACPDVRMLPGVVTLREVDVPEVPLEQLRPIIGDARADRLQATAAASRTLLEGRVIWNINSTASGGGVAEMLQVLVGYIRGAGIVTRWLVMEGDPQFFAITKRVHNRIHGMAGDGGPLGATEADHYR